MQNFQTVAQTLLGETAHSGFCPPKIWLIGGVGGVPEFFLLHWNPNIFVSLEPMQKIKILRQSLLV